MAPSCRAPFHRPSTGRHFRSDRLETDDAPNEMRKPQHRPDPESPQATTIATAILEVPERVSEPTCNHCPRWSPQSPRESDSDPHTPHMPESLFHQAAEPRDSAPARSTVNDAYETAVGRSQQIGIIGINALNGLSRWMAARTQQTLERNPSWKTPPPEQRLPPAQSEAVTAESTVGQRAESTGSAEDTRNSVCDDRQAGDSKACDAVDATASIIDQCISRSHENDNGDFNQQTFIEGGLS